VAGATSTGAPDAASVLSYPARRRYEAGR
jgi:hypothetical protein